MPHFSNANSEVIAKLSRVSATKVIGSPGTSIWNGYVQENENNAALTGSQKYTTYTNILLNTSIVAAGVRYFLNLIANSDWTVEPADDSAQAKQYAEIVEEIKDQLFTPWRRVVRKTAMYKFYGFSVQEWTAKRLDNGVIALHRIDARPQSTITRWLRDDIGDVVGVIQEDPQTFNEIELPIDKTIYIVDDALNDSPEGLGLFRHLAEPCRRLKRFEQLEGYGFETDLRGIPVGRAPFAELDGLVRSGELTEADKATILQPMTNFITNHIKNPSLGMLLDSITYQSEDESGSPSNVRQWDLELLKAGATSQPEMAAAIRRINEELARILNMEGLLLGSGPNGTRSLGDNKSDNLAIVTESTQKEIGENYDKSFIGSIGFLNGWNPELWPTFKPEPIRFRDITEITQALHDMAGAGAILSPEDPIINAVRDLLSMPHQPEDLNIADASLNSNRQTQPNIDTNQDEESGVDDGTE